MGFDTRLLTPRFQLAEELDCTGENGYTSSRGILLMMMMMMLMLMLIKICISKTHSILSVFRRGVFTCVG